MSSTTPTVESDIEFRKLETKRLQPIDHRTQEFRLGNYRLIAIERGVSLCRGQSETERREIDCLVNSYDEEIPTGISDIDLGFK